jgi:hypothetical protein
VVLLFLNFTTLLSSEQPPLKEEVAIYRKGMGYLWLYEWLLPETK